MLTLLIQIIAITSTFLIGVLIFLNITMPSRWMIGITYIMFAIVMAVVSFRAKGTIINIYYH